MKKRGGKELFLQDKKGQLTVFVVIALVVVAIGILIYLFYPQISSTLGGSTQDPNAFIQNCIEDEIQSTIDLVSLQGGNLEPILYVLNNDEQISYLCYTSNYYKTCVVQQPLLKEHIELEIASGIESSARNCFNELKSSFEGRGYTVSLTEGATSISILPGKVETTFNYSVTLSRTETQKYDSFAVTTNSNLYQFTSIANNIIDWEATYGNAETTAYMDLNHDLKVEKLSPQSEYGAKIYVLTNRNSLDKFQFASRSQVFPPGYGIADTK